MKRKEKLLKELEKEVVDQEKEKTDLERGEEFQGKKLDPITAPAVDVAEEMDKEWKHQEKEKQVMDEDDVEVDAGMGIEEEQAAGEEPNPEIEEELTREDTTDSEKED
jgi:hypothetical protein